MTTMSWHQELIGHLNVHVIRSEALADNPLGDPADRPLWVYVPPGYDEEPGRRYPSVYVIQGYTGQLAMWGNQTPFRQPFPQTADAMFAEARLRRASSSTSTRGRPMGGRSSLILRVLVGITRTSARMWSISWIPGIARCQRLGTVASTANLVEGLEP
jgi:hypothetical protein